MCFSLSKTLLLKKTLRLESDEYESKVQTVINVQSNEEQSKRIESLGEDIEGLNEDLNESMSQ